MYGPLGEKLCLKNYHIMVDIIFSNALHLYDSSYSGLHGVQWCYERLFFVSLILHTWSQSSHMQYLWFTRVQH